jgi:hypothetical protein
MPVLSIVLSAVALATPASFTVRLDDSSSPLVAGTHVSSLPVARRVFGKPDRLVGCAATWSRYRVSTTFTKGPSGCGAWQRVTLRSPRWHTRAGLHVGDPAAKLHALYPDASSLAFVGAGLWELETGGPLCDGGPPLALAGRIAGGTVTALVAVHVPACG